MSSGFAFARQNFGGEVKHFLGSVSFVFKRQSCNGWVIFSGCGFAVWAEAGFQFAWKAGETRLNLRVYRCSLYLILVKTDCFWRGKMEFFACLGMEILYFARKSEQEFKAFLPIYKGVLWDFGRCRMRCKNTFCTSVLSGLNFRKNAMFRLANFTFCKFYNLQNSRNMFGDTKR